MQALPGPHNNLDYFCTRLIIRKIISIFLLLVLSIQLLPLKQTVTWLLGGQMTEELVHTGDDGKSSHPGDDLYKQFLPVYSPTLVHSVLLTSLALGHDRSEDLKGRHADDITTPPPNC
jgi:hypothetical protein